SPMNVRQVLDRLAAQSHYRDQMVHVEVLPAQPARTRQPAEPLHPVVARALKAYGIEALYSHQADAIDAVRRGEHVAIVTGTPSGKSLCYHLPILESLVTEPGATALYLFPTKALAQDQLRGLVRWKEIEPELPIMAGTYDGDTPAHTRRKLRDEGNLILTNPDMLHSGILPRHT